VIKIETEMGKTWKCT